MRMLRPSIARRPLQAKGASAAAPAAQRQNAIASGWTPVAYLTSTADVEAATIPTDKMIQGGHMTPGAEG
jgi:hypothetical protein